MSSFINAATTFAVATILLFVITPSSAAPTATGDFHILPYSPFIPAGQIQQDSIPDPGIGNWFTSIFDTLKKLIGSNLKNGDPKKIEEVKKYIKRMRTFVIPVANFIQQFYPNDAAASNVMKAINGFLASLEEMVEQPSISMSQEDIESLVKLMSIMEAVKS